MAGNDKGSGLSRRSFAVRRPVVTTIAIYLVLVGANTAWGLTQGVSWVLLLVSAVWMIPVTAYVGYRFLVRNPGRFAELVERADRTGDEYPVPYVRPPGRAQVSDEPFEPASWQMPPRDDDDILRR